MSHKISTPGLGADYEALIGDSSASLGCSWAIRPLKAIINADETMVVPERVHHFVIQEFVVDTDGEAVILTDSLIATVV